VAALDGAGAGRPDCRDNLGDIPVRVFTAIFRQPQPVQLMKSLAVIAGLLFYFASGPGAWGVDPNEPAARLGRIGGALLAFSSGRHAGHLPRC
jgi:hypothetical protein